MCVCYGDKTHHVFLVFLLCVCVDSLSHVAAAAHAATQCVLWHALHQPQTSRLQSSPHLVEALSKVMSLAHSIPLPLHPSHSLLIILVCYQIQPCSSFDLLDVCMICMHSLSHSISDLCDTLASSSEITYVH